MRETVDRERGVEAVLREIERWIGVSGGETLECCIYEPNNEAWAAIFMGLQTIYGDEPPKRSASENGLIFRDGPTSVN